MRPFLAAISLVGLGLTSLPAQNLRPTLGNRLVERSLDVLDHVVRLRYPRRRKELFGEANLARDDVLSNVAEG